MKNITIKILPKPNQAVLLANEKKKKIKNRWVKIEGHPQLLPSFPPELTPNSHDVCKTYTHPCLFIPCVPGILCIFPPFVLAHTLVWLCDLLLFHSHIVTIWDAADTWATHEISSDIARINFTKARMCFIFSKFQFGGGIKNSLHQDAVKSIKRFFLIDKDLLFDNFFPFLSPAINK